MAYMKLRYARRDDTPFFRMAHHRVTKIFRLRIGRFYFAYNTQNMLALFSRAKIAAQYCVTSLEFIDIGNALDNVSQMTRRHNATGPFAVLCVVRKLNGIQRPDICAKTTHWKFCCTVARMTKNNVGLDGEDILHFTYHNPEKIKGRSFPRPC